MFTYEQILQYTGDPYFLPDADKYWDDAVTESKLDGDRYVLKKVRETQNEEHFYLTFMGIGGDEVFCLFARPKNIREKSPAVCFFEGYRGKSDEKLSKLFEERTTWGEEYTSKGLSYLFMGVRGQWYESPNSVVSRGFEFPHLYLTNLLSDDPKDSYFRAIFTDAAKCVRILLSMDFVSEVYVTGFSQGGDLTVFAAALEPRVKRILFGGVGSLDFKRYVTDDVAYKDAALKHSLRLYFEQCDPDKKTMDKIIEKTSYMDLLLLAKRINADVYNMVGLQDRICPVAGQMALYNNLVVVNKKLDMMCEAGHGVPKYKKDEVPHILSSARNCRIFERETD